MPEETILQSCHHCNQEKPKSAFYRPEQCKECRQKVNRAAKARYRSTRRYLQTRTAYRNSEKFKILNKEWQRKYGQTDKGRLIRQNHSRKHAQTERRKNSNRQYKLTIRQKVSSPGHITPQVLSCSRCQVQKRFDEFFASTSSQGGRYPRCKACCLQFLRTEAGKKIKRRAYRKWKSKRPIRTRQPGRQKTNQERLYRLNYRLNNQDKIRARNAVNYAVISGKLLKPSMCSQCKQAKRLTGHHHSYAKEFWLDVQWLCHKCHEALHHPEAMVSLAIV